MQLASALTHSNLKNNASGNLNNIRKVVSCLKSRLNFDSSLESSLESLE